MTKLPVPPASRILSNYAAEWRKQTETGVRLVAFGSSNTVLHWHSQGRHNWVNWLECSLMEPVGWHVRVINAGKGGDTIRDLLVRYERDVLPLSPTALILTIGGNDRAQGLTLYEYRADLTRCRRA